MNRLEVAGRECGRERLERVGFETVTAGTKEGGVAAAREHLPDLILMDIRMPLEEGGEESQTAGLEATAELRKTCWKAPW